MKTATNDYKCSRNGVVFDLDMEIICRVEIDHEEPKITSDPYDSYPGHHCEDRDVTAVSICGGKPLSIESMKKLLSIPEVEAALRTRPLPDIF